MNWMLMSVGGVILICMIVGFCRGAIRIAVSLLTTIVTLVLVFFVTPYVAHTIEKYTPMDDMIRSQVSSAMVNAAATELAEAAGEQVEQGLNADSVRRVLKAAGISEEELAEYGISVEDIVNGNVSSEDLAQYGISGNILAGLNQGKNESLADALDHANIPKEIQDKAIDSADLPQIFKNLLASNNNEETYSKVGAETFPQYVGNYLSKMIINMVAFLCTFILVTIVVRAIVFALDIVSELPILGLINRLAGGLAGIIGALFIVWTCFALITLLYTTAIGRELYDTIQSDQILKMIYDYNPVLKLAVTLKK